ncbi:arginine biosynthesis bifunctional protein ArgJ [Denitrovibrio acetiphilus DSM 12809]|uniref:Arginine biosynthesis bifunctional protein ArgJ n=1 Tax=Denitrovibrio acetiphilus (strain DSM 12809 / NBRC 114555 / N2460) TaxID=522772 RepID=D4H3H3_DENA2|nr:bifunctional glutamate N-acetyltransferase/amino-acid acetyltransferase ArgJ [Denitrovibrio acetiphilus]ADD67257.1 arginine biosynthesis bifunctional protein ArgJ [Denitrovibrio acetiphilus DSM 12809]
MQNIKGAGVCTPLGYLASSVAADIKGNKKGKKDLTLLYSEVPFTLAAVFTKNTIKAAPLKHAIKALETNREFSAIVVNSGNANASTGKQGLEAVDTIVKAFEDELGTGEGSVLMGSTGTIGVKMPVEKVTSSVKELVDELDDANSHDFAAAIMTTDTVPKEIGVLVETPNGAYVVAGTTKGAGMIAPHMATMLCYITTDALIGADNLQNVLNNAVGESFNSITIDNDMSTNDTVFLMANGMSGIIPDIDQFQEAVNHVALELAKMIVKDGEGATKFVTIKVKNAQSEADAKKCAFAIANSPLVKTMFYGEDPNWGRLIATVGASGVAAVEEKIDICFDDLAYVKDGIIIDEKLEEKAAKIMKNDEIEITIDLNMGTFGKTVYTCDFSKEYVSINADYRT